MHRLNAMMACAFAAVFLAVLVPAAAQARSNRSTQMIEAINQARAARGLPALHASGSLVRTSTAFSRSLMARDAFAHRAHTSTSARFGRAGEALALHSGRGLGVRSTVRAWLRSPEHRPIVLTHDMRYLGAGATRGNFRGHKATIWVLQVGSY